MYFAIFAGRRIKKINAQTTDQALAQASIMGARGIIDPNGKVTVI